MKYVARLGYVEAVKRSDERIEVVRLTEAAEGISGQRGALAVVISRLNHAERALFHILYAKILYKRRKWAESYCFLEKVKSGEVRGTSCSSLCTAYRPSWSSLI